MRYLAAFLHSVGDRWFLLPSATSGCIGVVGVLGKLGMTWAPDLSWWAIAFFVLLPISVWSIPALVKKVVFLEEELKPNILLLEPHLYKERGIQKIRLELRNAGSRLLSECLVTLDCIDPRPLNRDVTDFPVAIPTVYQKQQYRKGSFKLRPNQPKWIEPIRYASGNPRNPITVETEQWEQKLDVGKKYTFTISVYSEHGASSEQIFVIYVKDEKLYLEKK